MKDFLWLCLKYYNNVPSFALWRAIELRLISELELKRPLLDLGCGNGIFAMLLLGRGGADYGIDRDPEQVDNAMRLGAHINLAVMDACEMSFPDATFNAILSNCVFEHIPDLEKTLRECHRVLRSQGVLTFTVPSEYFHSFLYHYRRLLREGHEESARQYLNRTDLRHEHLRYLSLPEWQDLLQSCGFKLTYFQYYLSEKTLSFWDRLESFYTLETNSVLASRKFKALTVLALISPQPLARAYWYRRLKDFYLTDVDEGTRGGALLIRCAKK